VAASTTAPIPPAEASSGRSTPVVDVTLVQANIYTGLTVPKFQADVATVLALKPDFVTYNEVMFRHDEVLAPDGYDIYRSTRNRFTAETPVAWRSDRWKAIAHGTFRISNHHGVPPGKEIELGRRFANWVTLKGTDGRVLSVVSIHVAPLTRGMPDLLPHSIRRLGILVGDLAPKGPVLVGGDFNVHYTSGRYPRELLSDARLEPTYDTMGAYFPTGDHFGATIDYAFERGTRTLLADQQYPVELNSDHDAVVAGYAWQRDLQSQSHVVSNDPTGDTTSQRAAVTALVDGIKAATPGSTVDVATTRLSLRRIVRQLRAAVDRGVRVHVVVANRQVTAPERRLQHHMEAVGDPHNWLQRCVSTCRDTYDQSGVPRGLLMVRDPSQVWKARYDASRTLSRVLVERSSRVRISVGEVALREGVALFHGIS
jgi:endonuclease/exonuclease/phosphatase (EEP) superfamily protein YafD